MTGCHLSEHAQKRARQRGLRGQDVAFVVEHGTLVGRGVVLSDTDVAALESEAWTTIEAARRLRGTFVAIAGDTVKTAFKASTRQLRKWL